MSKTRGEICKFVYLFKKVGWEKDRCNTTTMFRTVICTDRLIRKCIILTPRSIENILKINVINITMILKIYWKIHIKQILQINIEHYSMIACYSNSENILKINTSKKFWNDIKHWRLKFHSDI